MSSSGGSYSGPISSPVGPPIPDLPVAGKDSTIGDPYEYGKFQSFLPDAKASGPNDMATGLRPEMFQYRKPTGVKDPRDELAAAMTPAPAAAAPANNPQFAALRAQMSPQDIAMFQSQVSPAEFAAFMSATPASGGGVGTMGLGSGQGDLDAMRRANQPDTWTNAS
jgi:hypothetical protein